MRLLKRCLPTNIEKQFALVTARIGPNFELHASRDLLTLITESLSVRREAKTCVFRSKQIVHPALV